MLRVEKTRGTALTWVKRENTTPSRCAQNATVVSLQACPMLSNRNVLGQNLTQSATVLISRRFTVLRPLKSVKLGARPTLDANSSPGEMGGASTRTAMGPHRTLAGPTGGRVVQGATATGTAPTPGIATPHTPSVAQTTSAAKGTRSLNQQQMDHLRTFQ